MPSADTIDLFTLPDFDDDDKDNKDYKDYEPPVRGKKRRKAVPLVDDDDDEDQGNGDDDDDDEDKEEQGNGDDAEDKDYEVENEDKEDEDEEDDDEEITLQKGKADERKKKLVVRSKRMDTDVVMEEMPRSPGQWCANVEQVTEFRSYIKSIMKAFEEHVKRENK